MGVGFRASLQEFLICDTDAGLPGRSGYRE